MKRLTYILLVLVALPVDGVQWNSASCSQSVAINSHFTCGNYNINNLQFSAPIKGIKNLNGNIVPEYTVTPSITFDLYLNTTLIEKGIILTDADNSYIDLRRTVMINASSFSDPKSNAYVIESYNPSATLTLYTRMLPQYTVTISTDKDSYDYTHDDIINATIELKNTGSVDVDELHVNIRANELNTSGQLRFTIPLASNEVRDFNYKFGVPHATGTYPILVNLTSSDSSTGDFYANGYEHDVIVIQPSPRVMITKYLPGHIYINDKVIETIIINNYGNVPITGVGVRDDTGFVFVTNESKTKSEWTLYTIEPNSQKEIQYIVIPNKIGNGQFLPVATVDYMFIGKEYMNVSNIPIVDIIDVPGFFRESITPTPTPAPIPTENITTNVTIPATVQQTINQPDPQPPMRTPGFDGILGVLALLIVINFVRRIQ